MKKRNLLVILIVEIKILTNLDKKSQMLVHSMIVIVF